MCSQGFSFYSAQPFATSVRNQVAKLCLWLWGVVKKCRLDGVLEVDFLANSSVLVIMLGFATCVEVAFAFLRGRRNTFC